MKPPANKRNHKILIYAGVAGAVLALVVMLKRKGASSEAPAEAASPTYASSPSGIPATGETGNLAAFENSLTEQIPLAIASGVQAGLANNQPATSPSSLPETIAALGTFLGSIQQSRTGEQTGAGAQGSPSQGTTPTVVNVAPAAPAASAPVASAPAKTSAPAKGPTFTTKKCGNGCDGHFYSDGHVECQTKTAGKCHW